MHSDRLCILFIKAPLPGTVKSRLAAAIGSEAAADLYRMLVLDAVDMLAGTGHDVRIYYAPPEASILVAEMLGRDRPLLPQSGNDLGEKMENALRDAFSLGCDRAILVGSDIPELSAAIIDQAFAALERNDTVLGPASDGGYYLIGFRKNSLLPDVFRGIAWSTPSVFEETMKVMHSKSLRVHVLPGLHDVDTAADLKEFWERSRQAGRMSSRVLKYLEQNQNALFRNP